MAIDGFGVYDVLKFVITFSAGIYTGVYISQNYDVPRVDQPSKFIERIKEIANDHKKK
ncbi:uncharacterized protein LOC119672824 [Teleopsis dalmanni]|nr:uncharacterized protein LOC119672824 [Teleopsis dalmanni]